MFDLGRWGEILIIVIVALVVVGPKDLPKVLRWIGLWVGRLRRYMYLLQQRVDQISLEEELSRPQKMTKNFADAQERTPPQSDPMSAQSHFSAAETSRKDNADRNSPHDR